MKRRILLLLSVLLLFTLAACGQIASGSMSGQSSPTWQEQYDLGVRYLSEGNYEEAIIAFTAAIEIDPKQAPAYVGRGDAYIGSGETEENLAAALADYEKAVELDETCAEGYLGIADVYIRRGEYDKALEILKTGLEKTENNQSIADKIAEMEEGNITDSSGNVRRMSTYADGSLLYSLEYTYNEIGQESSVTSFDGAGNETGHVDLEYNSDGKQTVSYWYNHEGVRPTIRTYNEKGYLVKDVSYEDAALKVPTGEMTLYFYDEAGREIQMEFYWGNQLNEKRTMEYDDRGNIIRINYYDGQGNFSSYEVYEYDSNGNVVWAGYYSPDGNLDGYTIITYDENGEILRDDYYKDGELFSSNVYE